MFPGGRPGSGLLLLRAAVGITAVTQGGIYLADWSSSTFGIWVVVLLTVASGVSLLIGFLTPVTCALAAAGTVLLRIQAPTPILFDAELAILFVVIMATAIGFLGPGAFSVDSRLFGRREIIIPPRSGLPKA
jgi:uncharacterized membrane protein YphA (DoxX/SURF4 family)